MRSLIELQQSIAREAESTAAYECERLWFAEVRDSLHVDFYGSPFGDAFGALLTILSGPDCSRRLRWLSLRGPDEGANGTRNWDLTPLLAAPAFPSLAVLQVEQNKADDHNRSVVAVRYEEDGMLAEILRRSPNLEELTVPSAPDARFFAVGERPIRFLSVDSGYDTQSFITNLAKSTSFPKLYSLHFGEYQETHLDDWQLQCTPFEAYVELFRSDAFAHVKSTTLRNPILSPPQLETLGALRPDIQLMIVRTHSSYVRP